jgi:hypothetical protein
VGFVAALLYPPYEFYGLKVVPWNSELNADVITRIVIWARRIVLCFPSRPLRPSRFKIFLGFESAVKIFLGFESAVKL